MRENFLQVYQSEEKKHELYIYQESYIFQTNLTNHSKPININADNLSNPIKSCCKI